MLWALGRAATVLLVVMAAACLSPAVAKDDRPWPVKNRLVGADGKKSKDVSGIACTSAHGFPRSCLVIDDNLQAAQLVTVMDGEIVAGDLVPLIGNTHDGEPLELDGEGVAYADGYYYVIGSHGRPRYATRSLKPKDRARIAAASQVVRFSVGPGGEPGAVERTGRLREIIRSYAVLRKFADRRLDRNG